jgi:hypothetical protein
MKKFWRGLGQSLLNAMGNMFPLIGGVILVLLFGQWKGFIDFYQNGEFFIYSTTFLVTSIYIFHEKRPLSKLHYLFLFFMFISVLLYSAIKSSILISSQNAVEPNALKFYSIILLSISFIILLISNSIDAKSLDFYKKDQENINDLDEEIGVE